MVPSAAWESAARRVQFATSRTARIGYMARPSSLTAHLRDLGASVSAPRRARQSPGQRQKSSRSKDGSWFDLPTGATRVNAPPEAEYRRGVDPLETVDSRFRSSLGRLHIIAKPYTGQAATA